MPDVIEQIMFDKCMCSTGLDCQEIVVPGTPEINVQHDETTKNVEEVVARPEPGSEKPEPGSEKPTAIVVQKPTTMVERKRHSLFSRLTECIVHCCCAPTADERLKLRARSIGTPPLDEGEIAATVRASPYPLEPHPNSSAHSVGSPVAGNGSVGSEQLVLDQKGLNAPTDLDAAAFYEVNVDSIRELAKEFPDCPPAELARYLARRSVSGSTKKATPLIHAYLHWREKELPTLPAAPSDMALPLRFDGHSRDGTRILLFLPCMISVSFTPEMYTNEMLRFLDKNIRREQMTRLVVLMDVRAHAALGYKASSALRLFRHLSMMGKAFQTYFPERLKLAIVYPFGDIEMKAYTLFSYVFSQATLKRVVCLHDKGGAEARAPPKALLEHINPDQIREENRQFFAGL